jgi:hypothetical protein
MIMNEQSTMQATQISFKQFLFNERYHRIILWITVVAIIIQFAIFKYLYPNASFIHDDSFSYLKAADQNLSINTYMIGYSKFLRLFSVFTKSDLGLAAFQYLFIQFSNMFLLLSLFYFYKPGKVMRVIVYCFIVFNPLFLYLANLVSSDGIFFGLSMIWFSLLLWIINRPSRKIILCHAIVLFFAFAVRYNALIYPFISVVAFWLSKISIREKLVGIGITFLFCGLFVGFTSYQYKKLTKHWQYSPFSGWQLANNALYAYRYVDSADRKPVPFKFQPLDKKVREFFDSTRDVTKFPTEAEMASTFYMWSPGMPLMKYRNEVLINDTNELKKWATMGPLYKAYGLYLIKQYPLYYIQYFIWPNACKYYAPLTEFLGNYNSEKIFVNELTKNWFGYKSILVRTRTASNNVWILDFYPILSGIINVVMLFCLICHSQLKKENFINRFNQGILLGGVVWLFNAAFTIAASSPALRFQSFPIILTTIYVALLVDWMVQLMSNIKQAVQLGENIVAMNNN